MRPASPLTLSTPHTHPTPSCQRREVQALQAQIAKLKRAAKQPAYERRASDIAEFARVKQELGAKVERLREEKRELQEIKEELEFMNECLRVQVQGTQGLVSPRSGSPVTVVAPRPMPG